MLKKSASIFVHEFLDHYISSCKRNRVTPSGLHDLVMEEVERELIDKTLKYCGGNQSVASKVLGINRNTLRKKLSNYRLQNNGPLSFFVLEKDL